MTMFFPASDTHSVVPVIAETKEQAEAWARRQAIPARYEPFAYKQFVGFGDLNVPEIVVLASTLPRHLSNNLIVLVSEATKIRRVF
jgi:hypothetical protein